jgi:hypothetical protein
MKEIKYNVKLFLLAALLGVIAGCNTKKENKMEQFEKGTFGYDLSYLSKYDSSLLVLKDASSQSQLIVSAAYQGKVFTSTADGEQGKSLGFINYKVFEAGVLDEHINTYGGENRLWLGPEGGQYSIFFKKGEEQIYDNWHTPKPIDVEAWEVISVAEASVTMRKEMEVTNFPGTKLQLNIDRTVSLADLKAVSAKLGVAISSNVKAVAYETDNIITNLNDFAWTPETGTVCIWMLDMFNTAPNAVTIVPYNSGEEAKLGKIVTSDYFGEIPADRLKIDGKLIYLKTDGKYRSKLGLNARRTTGYAGNYDPDAGRLTIILYDVESEATYLSQEWNPDKEPLKGDAMNAYNDGPLDDGSIMGPFLELESVSPAAFLQPSQSISHKHTVCHFIGSAAELSPITEKLFNATTEELSRVFGK